MIDALMREEEDGLHARVKLHDLPGLLEQLMRHQLA